MTGGQRARYAGVLVASVVLAVVELFFLPLRLDGRLLPQVGDLPFPITAVLAGVTLPWLVAVAARIKLKAAFAGGPLYAWLATIFVFVVGGPGGDLIMVREQWRLVVLLAAGAFPATIKIGDVLARSIRAQADADRG